MKKSSHLAGLLSGWQDSNLRPPAPKAGAIPGYATPRDLRLPTAKLVFDLGAKAPRDTGLRYTPSLKEEFLLGLQR